MKNQKLLRFLFLIFATSGVLIAQEEKPPAKTGKTTILFKDQSILPIKLCFSNREMKKETNDSTYLLSKLIYKNNEKWDSIDVKIRARGDFRRANCYFAPLKIKIKKAVAKETIFKGNKQLKIVMPCVQSSSTQDNIVKEYMAYKIYEVISPYHYKTRMADIEYIELRGKKSKVHNIKGFLIEDIDKVAKRQNSKKLKRTVHPLEQDDMGATLNDFFQFMIGNTDYSTAYQHNQKLVFTEDYKTIPLPYDFDMSGLVDASYAVVSQVQGEVLSIESVTDRLYRGFDRDEAVIRAVQKHYLDNKDRVFEVIDGIEPQFDNKKEFQIARNFIDDFYKILSDENKFKNEILRKGRTK
ncbi:MAG: hypothetical protein HKP53_10635 [Eudoraea sp.]|nr:hypothetical protein [Eudoraea sp.]